MLVKAPLRKAWTESETYPPCWSAEHRRLRMEIHEGTPQRRAMPSLRLQDSQPRVDGDGRGAFQKALGNTTFCPGQRKRRYPP
jgi:hypothetical protein